MSALPEWPNEFPSAITITGADGTILYMNAQSCKLFDEDGGAKLIGTNVLECHPAHARAILEDLLASGKSNTYTIEKNGKKKLIHQAPWFKEASMRGWLRLLSFCLTICSTL